MGTQLASASPASAKRKLAAHFVELNVSTASNCGYVTGVEFAQVPKAISYTIRYYDRDYNGVETASDTPAQLQQADAQYASYLPRGENFLPVTAYYTSPPCGTFTPDPTDGGRFSKGAKAWVVLPRFKLSGLVLTQRCTKSSCTRKPNSGVTVVAKPVGSGSGGQATTGKDGRYSMELEPGSYDVSLRGVKGIPTRRTVTLSGDISGADFHICGSGSAADKGRVARSATLLHCDFKVEVTVVNVNDKPLRGVRVQAATSGPWPDYLGPDVVLGTTGSDGRATLDLWTGDPWVVRVINALPDINPPEADFFASHIGRVQQPAGYFKDASCVGGTDFLGGCKFTSRDAVSGRGSVAMQVKALVVPVDLSFGPGLRSGLAFIRDTTNDYHNAQLGGFLDNNGERVTLPNHLHLELPVARHGAEVDNIFAFSATSQATHHHTAASVAACSGKTRVIQMDPFTDGSPKEPVQVCSLTLSTTSAPQSASFSAGK